MIIRGLIHNDTVECINLMDKYSFHAHYERDEAMWIQHLITTIVEANKGNPHHLAIGCFDDDEYLLGFLLGGSFKNYYNQSYVFDVKDCIIEEEKGKLLSAKVAVKLFDNMIEHVKKHGGIHWRADSIRDGHAGIQYCEFLNRKYNAKIHYGVRGIIEGD